MKAGKPGSIPMFGAADIHQGIYINWYSLIIKIISLSELIARNLRKFLGFKENIFRVIIHN